MKTIIANLKLYLPNRHFWSVYLSVTVLLCFMIIFTKEQKQNETVIIGSFVVIQFFAGFAAALMQIDILTKTFSFCLPEYKQNVRKVLLILGIVICIVMSFLTVFLVLNQQMSLLIISTIFFASLFFYWLGVEACFFVRGIIAIIILLIFIFFSYRYPYELLGGFIVNHPVLVICISLISSIYAWRLMNPFKFARRFCAVPLLTGIFDFYNKEKLEKYAKYRQALKEEKLTPLINPSVEKFFFNRMKKHDFFGMGRYIWGNLCVYSFPMVKTKPVYVLWFAAIIALYSYFMSFSFITIFAMTIFSAALSPIPLFSTMLISDGRKERFYSTLYVSFAACLSIMVILILACLISVLAAPYMPAFTFSGISIVYRALSFKSCFIPFFIVPFAFSFKVLLHKKRALQFFTLSLLYILFVISSGAIGSYLKVGIEDIPGIFLNPISILVFIVSSWIIYIPSLRYVCFRKSLI